MQDYSKLTVAKLKEELDNRGLPKAGLKAALVQRLEEADAKAAKETPEEHGHESAQPIAQSEENNDQRDQSESAKNAASALDVAANPQQVAIEENEPTTKPVNGHTEEESEQQGDSDLVVPAKQENKADPVQTVPASTVQDEVLPGTVTQHSEAQLPTPALTQVELLSTQPPMSTQTSIAPEEVAEDSRKRRRRSQTPPPSSVDTSKRLKGEASVDERPDVKLPEDLTSQESHMDLDTQPAANASQVNRQTELEQANGLPKPVTAQSSTDDPAHQPAVADSTPRKSRSRSRTPPQPIKSEQNFKSPQSDRRFQSLTGSTTKAVSPPPPRSEPLDRDIPPSIHPATTALYIRNLMRPLNPSSFKSHLTSLAQPSSSPPPDPSEIITAFHIDPIRTHALVSFTSTSFAGRVRANLHDRVWPNERDRKALWVDFIPEEKVEKWIEVETVDSGGGGRAGNKRWEVVYETEDDDGVQAYLQEVGSAAPLAKQQQQRQQAPAAAASSSRKEEPPAVPTEVKSKEFKALDDLFLSTSTAKPKLYYLPVSKEIAERRLDLLAEGRGGGRGGDEMKRYSFVQDKDRDGERIVDNGPEFGYGRGGRGGRGRGDRGGYRGRGGPPPYRGGGDSWGGRGC